MYENEDDMSPQEVVEEKFGDTVCMKCLEDININEGDRLSVIDLSVTELESLENSAPLVAQKVRNNQGEGIFHGECYDIIYEEWIGVDADFYDETIKDLDSEEFMNTESCPSCGITLLYDERYDGLDGDCCPECQTDIRYTLGEPPKGKIRTEGGN